MNAPINDFIYVWMNGGWGWRILTLMAVFGGGSLLASTLVIPGVALTVGWIFLCLGVLIYILRGRFFNGPVPR